MRPTRPTMCLLLAFLCAASLVACESGESTDAGPVRIGPLAFDPTERVELAEWWTNGEQLLQLRDDHAYAIYPGENRYRLPLERGRWTRLNYRALYFEPYAGRGAEDRRVSLDKADDGTIVMLIDDQMPMVGVESPPEVLEDELFGTWAGDRFEIILRPTMRYRFRRVARPPGAVAGVAAHGGRWRIESDAGVLDPDAGGLEQVVIDVTVRDNRIVLEGMNRVR